MRSSTPTMRRSSWMAHRRRPSCSLPKSGTPPRSCSARVDSAACGVQSRRSPAPATHRKGRGNPSQQRTHRARRGLPRSSARRSSIPRPRGRPPRSRRLARPPRPPRRPPRPPRDPSERPRPLRHRSPSAARGRLLPGVPRTAGRREAQARDGLRGALPRPQAPASRRPSRHKQTARACHSKRSPRDGAHDRSRLLRRLNTVREY